jgi:hypothetical protein
MSKKKITEELDKLLARPVKIDQGIRWDIFEKDYLQMTNLKSEISMV